MVNQVFEYIFRRFSSHLNWVDCFFLKIPYDEDAMGRAHTKRRLNKGETKHGANPETQFTF